MRCALRYGLWGFVLSLTLIIVFGEVANTSARNTSVRGSFVSLVRPTDLPDRDELKKGPLDSILGATATVADPKQNHLGKVSALTWHGRHRNFPFRKTASPDDRSAGELDYDLSGSKMHRWLEGKLFPKPASPTFGKQGAQLLDSDNLRASAGKLAGSPLGVYSAFDIEVNRATYIVRLFGITHSGERNELFSCRAGLGSEEYPTPRGSWYILRIFDNHPTWIPPDRPWAYGMTPSKSVYGGHMMPFLTKTQARLNRQADGAADQDLDRISPEMQVIDAGAYRIHGTDSPWSVGSRQSHGCIRLHNKSVKELADLLKLYVGTTSRGTAPNGDYVDLLRPVKLTLF
jgi:hypothetical protein